mmetsp:Transcript_25404/g.63487  ORF Transcript_25404/g.63487 Transcript_25404/m.63487 type:complete len:115 (+) Transcript_25404:204-548(+)
MTDASPTTSGGGDYLNITDPLDLLPAPLAARLRTIRLQRTFFCIGPLCLRSGHGFGVGIGCGVGIGKGWAGFELGGSPGGGGEGMPSFEVPYQVMNRIPGGYTPLLPFCTAAAR